MVKHAVVVRKTRVRFPPSTLKEVGGVLRSSLEFQFPPRNVIERGS